MCWPVLPTAAGTLETTIDLVDLHREAIRAIAEQILHGLVAEALIDFLMTKSGGRPFFAEQLILDLQEQGQVQEQFQCKGVSAL